MITKECPACGSQLPVADGHYPYHRIKSGALCAKSSKEMKS